MGFGPYADLSAVSGDNDSALMKDASAAATKEVFAKNLTGGMLAHSSGSEALYYFNYASLGAASYRKIATLPATPLNGHLRVILNVDRYLSSEHHSIEIILGNRGTLTQRVLSISGESTIGLNKSGLRTYTEVDGTVSVYLYNDGTDYMSLSAQILSAGFTNVITIIPPNDVTSSSSPSGTLSLDTTAGKYANGVPDGNMDAISLTLLNGWTGNLYYCRASNGWTYIRGAITPGTETSGTAIATVPVGFRPDQNISYIGVTDTAGAAGGRFHVSSTTGQIIVYNLDTAGTVYHISINYMVGA